MEKKLPWVVTSDGTSERNTPEIPPNRKLNAHPMQNSMGTEYRIRPRHIVPMAHRKMNPVGSEISSVDSM